MGVRHCEGGLDLDDGRGPGIWSGNCFAACKKIIIIITKQTKQNKKIASAFNATNESLVLSWLL